jgi:hypothetical protein
VWFVPSWGDSHMGGADTGDRNQQVRHEGNRQGTDAEKSEVQSRRGTLSWSHQVPMRGWHLSHAEKGVKEFQPREGQEEGVSVRSPQGGVRVGSCLAPHLLKDQFEGRKCTQACPLDPICLRTIS